MSLQDVEDVDDVELAADDEPLEYDEGAEPAGTVDTADAPEASEDATDVIAAEPAPKSSSVQWLVDYTRTDRCECKRSGEALSRGEMRVVKTCISSNGFRMSYSFKVLPFFHMLGRMQETTTKPRSAQEFLGFEKLAQQDQARLIDLFNKFHAADPSLTAAQITEGSSKDRKRKYKRPRPEERRFICPYPGCTKAYASSGCLSRHKKLDHLDLPRELRRTHPPPPASFGGTDACVDGTDACLGGADACVGAADADADCSLPTANATVILDTDTQNDGALVAVPMPVPLGVPSDDAAALKRSAPIERRYRCPAEGCDKAYTTCHCLYIHKRNKHPQMIKPRAAKASQAPGTVDAPVAAATLELYDTLSHA